MSLTRVLGFRSLFKTVNATQIIQRFSSKFTINFSDPAVQKYLHSIILEHEKLMTKSRTLEEVKRLQMIKPIVTTLEQRITLYDSIDNLKELNKKEKDPELLKMIKEEAEIYLSKIQNIDSELQADLLEPFLTDGGVMMEVTAGAGGQEAMLFARELFEMYESYANYKEWEFDLVSFDKSDIGGIKQASALIKGYGAEEFMKLEAGVHRVQRIPATEKGGRIHTSTVSVAVLPQPSAIELEIPERDISIETKRASGAGGQHVNTTDSAVRITHLPTGMVVECQEGRSQIKNKQIAMEKLRTLLLKKYTEENNSLINSERKSQVGSSERNEKIRTYNYPQDRVTEHRPGGATIHNLKQFMEGGEQLEQLQETLLKQQKYQTLMDDINHFMKTYHGAENK